MHRDGVDMASSAVTHKLLHPLDTHWSSSVGDSRRYEFGFPKERFHVGLPDHSGCAGSNVGLSVEVRFVHTDEMRCSMVDTGLRVLRPVGSRAWAPAVRTIYVSGAFIEGSIETYNMGKNSIHLGSTPP